MGTAASLEGPLPGRMVSTRQDADSEGATVTEQSSMTAEEKAAGLREQMVQYLVEHGDARTPSVVAALRRVPRHLVAGADPERAYSPEKALVTKRSADGVGLSSVSAARIQAMQLEQADLLPGMRVLEVGSGLYRLHSVAARTWPRRACVGGRDFDALAAAAVGSCSGGSVRG